MIWEIIENDKMMYCESCDHKSKSWAENDNFTEWNFIDNEQCNQVRCPNCYSWDYFETEEDK